MNAITEGKSNYCGAAVYTVGTWYRYLLYRPCWNIVLYQTLAACDAVMLLGVARLLRRISNVNHNQGVSLWPLLCCKRCTLPWKTYALPKHTHVPVSKKQHEISKQQNKTIQRATNETRASALGGCNVH